MLFDDRSTLVFKNVGVNLCAAFRPDHFGQLTTIVAKYRTVDFVQRYFTVRPAICSRRRFIVVDALLEYYFVVDCMVVVVVAS